MNLIKMLLILSFTILNQSTLYCAYAIKAPQKANGIEAQIDKKKDNEKSQNKAAKETELYTLFNNAETNALKELFKGQALDPRKIEEKLKAHADPNATVDGKPFLAIALDKNAQVVVLYLLKYGAIPNKCNADGTSPISYINSVDHAEMLLQKPEHLEKDSFGNNPLHHLVGGSRAVWGNFDRSAPHADVIPYYIKRGVEKNELNNRGLTPLMSAVELGHLDMVIELYKQLVDLYVKNEHGQTAADIAKEKYEAETDSEKEERYHLIWIFLFQVYFNKDAFMNKNFNEIIATLKNLKLLNIPIVQAQGKLFIDIWAEAQTTRDKGLAITYLITALGDMKRDGKNIEKDLVAVEKFIQDNKNQISDFVRERSLERLKALE